MQADAINAIKGPRKIMDRCRAILSNSESIEYETYNSSVFEDNLEVVDAAMPKMLADLVKVHYFQQILAPRAAKKAGVFREADKLSSAVELLSKNEPYASKARKNFCEIKIKRFLRSCALGLMPSEEWDGKDDASGGYIVVLADGSIVALYVYNITTDGSIRIGGGRGVHITNQVQESAGLADVLATEACRAEMQPYRDAGRRVPGRFYRKYRTRPLLVLHVIRGKLAEDATVPNCDITRLAAWSLSFPGAAQTARANRLVSYVLNPVAARHCVFGADDEEGDEE